MKKRYRCNRKDFNMNLPGGKRILWAGYRYPPKGRPPCEDSKIINFIEAKPAFKTGLIWIDKEPEDILINPAAVPEDCEAAILQKAARRLVELGKSVNPKFLMPDEEEKPEEPPQLPSKTFISTAKRSELETVIKKFGWEFDSSLNVKGLKKAVRARVEELSTQEE